MIRALPPGALQPSVYQQAIFDAVQQGIKALVVAAVPGSGKTTTSKELIRYLPAGATVLALAFNVDAAKQLQEKIDALLVDMADAGLPAPLVESKTIHSLGNATLAASNLRSSVRPNKYKKLCRQYLHSRGQQDGNLVQLLSRLVDVVRLTLAETDVRSLIRLCTRFDIDIDQEDKEVWPIVLQAVPAILQAGIMQCKNGHEIDYTDMIWLPSVLNLQPRRYDYVLVDEAQDLSPAQRSLVLKARKSTGAFIAVGDRNQCQPAGTMVRLSNGTEAPIEVLCPGDTVYSFDRRSAAYVRTAVVTETASRHYEGQLYTLSVGGKQSHCTDSHKWLVRWVAGENAWITYLMRQGNRYRVGQTRMFVHQSTKGRGNFDFGLGFRARVERADAAWVLKIHHSFSEALAYEQILAATYGLPEVCFNEASGIKHFTQEVIGHIYTSLPPLEERAKKCLEAHRRKLEYPLYVRNEGQRQGRTTLFETQACNLISGYMAIPVAQDTIQTVHDRLQWETITVASEAYAGPVYSLNVERHHKYIADGLVTCNSIYGFAGASLRSIDEIIEETGARELPLSICYRCPKEVVALAASLYPGIQAAETAPDGCVEYITADKVAGMTRPGDLILCRLTAPLVEKCLELLRMGKRANVRGRDLGATFIALLEQVQKFNRQAFSFPLLETCVRNYEQKQIEVLSLHAEDNAMKIASLQDKIDTLLALHEAYAASDEQERLSLDGFVAYVKAFFTEDPGAQIILSTGHRAKGLEYPRVFLLEADKIPHPKAKTAETKVQEYNLMYVMYTRAKFERDIPESGTLFLVTASAVSAPRPQVQAEPVSCVQNVEEVTPTKKHAGGRPKKDRVRVNIKLDSDLQQLTEDLDRSELINTLLRQHFKLE